MDISDRCGRVIFVRYGDAVEVQRLIDACFEDAVVGVVGGGVPLAECALSGLPETMNDACQAVDNTFNAGFADRCVEGSVEGFNVDRLCR